MIRKPMPALALVLAVLAVATCAAAKSFRGEVVGVLDGHTIKVQQDGNIFKVRLWGIHCPKEGQRYAERARRFTANMALRKTVVVEVEKMNLYGWIAGQVILPDGRSLNEELVKAGLAWRYGKSSQYRPLGLLEAEARAAKRGLWADAHPIPPWEYSKARQTRRKK